MRTGGAWYRSLERPAWQPPDVVFGLIWPYNFLVLGGRDARRTQPDRRPVAVDRQRSPSAWRGALAWAYLFYVQQWPAALAWALAAAAVLTIRWSVALVQRLGRCRDDPYQVWLVLATSLAVGYAALNRGPERS